MTRFIVVRHGRSVANNDGVFSCMQDVPLADAGKAQAECVAAYLHQHESIDKIYTSGMQRTDQTAAPTAALFHLPLHTERGLREIFPGLWEGLPYAEIAKRYTADWHNWRFDFSNARCTAGESVRELYRRIQATLHRLAAENEGKTVMLTTHYTPLRLMVAMAMGYAPEQVHLSSIPTNATVNVLRYEAERLHLELADLVTYPEHLYSTNSHPLPPRMPHTRLNKK